jgi:TRAP-type C4-dicarboxylate transport system substrate-binding protein
MVKALARCSLLALVLLSSAAAAEPIKLKLAFTTSDRSAIYLYAIKPFVDAVNTEANGLIEIDVYFSGALGRSPQLPQLVLDGVADMAWIVPGQLPLRFPDDTVLELPGLFHDAREATLSYARLIHVNAQGIRRFFRDRNILQRAWKHPQPQTPDFAFRPQKHEGQRHQHDRGNGARTPGRSK